MEETQDKFTNFKLFQSNYRSKVRDFFHDVHNWNRLRRIHHLHTKKIYSVLVFFVVRYTKNRLHLSTRINETVSRHYCIRDEYENALKRYEKKFYDFGAKIGKGDLIYEGEVNPGIEISPPLVCMQADADMERAAAMIFPLAQINALAWLIEFGFDRVFWDHFKDVEREYHLFSTETRKRYTDTHKRKNRNLRREAEKEVLEIKKRASQAGASQVTRTESKKSAQTRRQPTKFTRREREQISTIIEEKKRTLKRRKQESTAKKKKTKTKSGSNVHKQTILLDQNIHVVY